jgi:hypothetical protein
MTGTSQWVWYNVYGITGANIVFYKFSGSDDISFEKYNEHYVSASKSGGSSASAVYQAKIGNVVIDDSKVTINYTSVTFNPPSERW